MTTLATSSPAAAAPRLSGTERVPAADGLRGLAAVAIVLHHSAFVSGNSLAPDRWGAIYSRLDVGVPVFFALSGFLLFRPFVARMVSGEADKPMWPFWRRRLLRIFPGYWLAFLSQLVIGAVSVLGVSGFALSVSLTHVYAGRRALSGITQSWSLATELAFYLVLPLYAMVAARVVRRRPPTQRLLVLLAGCVGWVVISVATRAAALQLNGAWQTNWRYTVFANADYFAVGMAVACLAVGGQVSPSFDALRRAMFARPWLWYLGAAVAFYITATQLGLPRGLEDADAQGELARQMGYLLVAVGTVGPACLATGNHTSTRLLSSRVAVFLGAVSYGLYLWHQIFLSAPHGVGYVLRAFHWQLFDAPLIPVFALATVGGVACGAASWYLVEKPILDRFR